LTYTIDLARQLELRIPPPIVALLVALAMWGVSRQTVAPIAVENVRVPLAVALALTGVAFDLAGLLAFRRARTTINPMRPQAASSLVESGVYRLTRNPMYVGLFLVLCGWAAFVASWWSLVGPFAFAGYIRRFQIAPEERALAARFGEPYLRYRARVRRWL
jgi:protein-S-isoprenylcysteine O-methyltransferase Ste14